MDKETKEVVQSALNSLKEIIKFWITSFQGFGKELRERKISKDYKSLIDSASLANPLEELEKLFKLIHAHSTKLGILFKPVIDNNKKNVILEEIKETNKVLILLTSACAQVQTETIKNNSFSFVFSSELNQYVLSLYEIYSRFVDELGESLDVTEFEDGDTDNRLICVGQIWESCDSLVKLIKGGQSGVLKRKIKETTSLITDACEELEEWTENPDAGGIDDPFKFNDGDDHDEESEDEDSKIPTKANDDDNKDQDDEEIDEELKKVVEYGKKWVYKIKLIKLLLSSLDKSIPSEKASKDKKHQNEYAKAIDSLDKSRMKLSEYTDDVVCTIIEDNDTSMADEFGDKLKKETDGIIKKVRTLNTNDEKKTKWLDNWSVKFKE
ncbi:hypothetical protein BVG19_g2731 [[Candida] boidinii]|nr:hypothetical protein BVG19_g2731 [[Candida] boidinii]OWB53682.1 hypothetical protein B5S27_g5288 [[Candida] boidinii]